MKAIYFFILCVAISLFFAFKLMAHEKNFNKKTIMLPTVDVIMAKSINAPVFVSSSGIAQSLHHVDIMPDVSGKVDKIFFKSGQLVRAGDLLVELDHQFISDQLQEEIYKKNYQDKNFQRYMQLADNEIIAKDNLDHIRSDLLQEKSKVHELQAELGKRFIRAPFAGKLGLREINLGQYIQAGEKIVNLQQSNKIIVDLRMSCDQIKNIRVGQKVMINNQTDLMGKVVAFDSSIDSRSHSFTARVLIDNQLRKILPGSYVMASVEVSDYRRVIVLPQSAISYDENGESIFVVRNGLVYEKSVVSEINGRNVFIISGVDQGEIVVVVGQNKLFDGEKVITQFS